MDSFRILKFDILIILSISFLEYAGSMIPVQSVPSVRSLDSLPSVFAKNHNDFVGYWYQTQAKIEFAKKILPHNIKEWESYKSNLKNNILKKAGVTIDHALPFNYEVKKEIQLNDYSIKNIIFQTRPGIYATANLYVPAGTGPFPAVLNLVGHFRKGKIDQSGQQAVGHSLALNGYVCLTLDPWGSGERTSINGVYEYHGANLGASLMNLGESLMGMQISDNIRGIDLLCSFPFVDRNKIGATGASGGGNQTMWLSAVDERIKASVPVVSVGTLESYIMRSQCICELLIDGLTFTEEAGVLALSMATMPCNHRKDVPVFLPSEMIRSISNARKIFLLRGESDHLSYRIFDLEHGYFMEDREAMLGWFDYHLKGIGTGASKKEKPFNLLSEEILNVFESGKRDAGIKSTSEYCIIKGSELRNSYLSNDSFDPVVKPAELQDIVGFKEDLFIERIQKLTASNGWERFILETSNNRIIPLLHFPVIDTSLGYVILCNPNGKKEISFTLINDWKKKGYGLVIADLTGTGESSSQADLSNYGGNLLHTLAIDELWLGSTLLGEWMNELNLVTQFTRKFFDPAKIILDGEKEAGLAGLFLGTLKGNIDSILLRNAPVSYMFDDRNSLDFFSMAIHLPGFLKWGDISLATALTNTNVTFINPVTMSGNRITNSKIEGFKAEFNRAREICSQKGATVFIEH